MGSDATARKRIELSTEMREWLRSGGRFPARLSITLHTRASMEYEVLDREDDGRVQAVASRHGHKGFTLRVKSTLNNRIYAAKLCLMEDYTAEKLQEEMQIASELDDRAPIVIHEFVGVVNPFENQPQPRDRWLCFISRWIDGQTLEHLVLKTPDKLQPDLAILVLRKLLQAVLYLEQKRIKHDDLHLGNVMLSKRPAEVRNADPGGDPYVIDIIDLGSVKRQDTPTAKLHDDRSSYVRALVQIHNCLHGQRHIAARYPVLLKRLFEFAQRLAEEDPTRQFFTAQTAYEPLDAAKRALHGTPIEADDALDSPFAAISAEHLASDKMLLNLFVDNLGWLDDVRESTPTVLTGPRGCGKSMVFRYLSFRTHLATEEASALALDDLQFIGVYVGCASDLQNDLLWIKREDGLAEQLAKQIVTFFNLVAARELFRTLSMVVRHCHISKALGITSESVAALIRFGDQELGLPNAHIAVAGLDPGQGIADELDRQRIRLSRAMLERRPAEVELPDTFLRDLTRAAVKLMPGLAAKPIVFLLDDFTQQRLGERVQATLNPILWLRDSACSFKISCEPFGFSSSHIDDAKVDQNREFIEVDTGERMHTGAPAETAMRQKFVAGLIDKRLKAAGYKGTVEKLIGPSTYVHDTELAIAIRNAGHGRSYHYHGIHVLANAWSGDVATVLFMVREMFQLGQVNRASETRISNRHQHEAIVNVSKALVERVTHCYPYGDEMRVILDKFARLARRLLIEGPLQVDTRSRKEVPQRRYRMEVVFDEDGGIVDQLRRLSESPHVALVFKELIRRSIFINLGESRSKDQKRTFRVQVRSSLLPHYGTSLGRKNYMAVHNLQEFALLLSRSDDFETRVWNRSAGSVISSMDDLFSRRDNS